jgi:hypothetical protein
MSTYTLTYNSKLTEDFIHSDSILASPTATTPLATFVSASETRVVQALDPERAYGPFYWAQNILRRFQRHSSL